MFEGSVALVTGASRGIGYGIAKSLAQAGATVIGTGTAQAGADKVSTMLAEYNSKGAGKVLDVTDKDSVTALLKCVGEEFGAPTILVNNAGITRDNLLMRMQDEEWSSVIDTNLTAVFRLCKACMRPMMKARKGRIINISSVTPFVGNPGQSNYAAAKAGLIGFTHSLAREVGSRGITVNAVAPGFIETDMTHELPESVVEGLLAQTALGRLGQVEDIAEAVKYLASHAAGYVTGQVLHVNGGIYMS